MGRRFLPMPQTADSNTLQMMISDQPKIVVQTLDRISFSMVVSVPWEKFHSSISKLL